MHSIFSRARTISTPKTSHDVATQDEFGRINSRGSARGLTASPLPTKKDKKDGAQSRPDTPSEKAGGATATSTNATDSADASSTPMSPVAGEGGPRAQTPTSRKSNQHPWTLHLKVPNAATDENVRDFFGEAKDAVSAF